MYFENTGFKKAVWVTLLKHILRSTGNVDAGNVNIVSVKVLLSSILFASITNKTDNTFSGHVITSVLK